MHARGERLRRRIPGQARAADALSRSRRAAARKLAALREFLAGSALSLAGGDAPTAADYANLIERVRDRPDFALLQTVLLRSLSQAQYRPENVGHFGLAYDAYAHFTSPIRRYPDLLTHRAIKGVLAGKRYTPSGQSWEALGCIAR